MILACLGATVRTQPVAAELKTVDHSAGLSSEQDWDLEKVSFCQDSRCIKTTYLKTEDQQTIPNWEPLLLAAPENLNPDLAAPRLP